MCVFAAAPSQYIETIGDVDRVLNLLVADSQRIELFAERGFAVPQPMPANVKQAYEHLVQQGLHSAAHLAFCGVSLLWIKGAPSARGPGLRAALALRPSRSAAAGRFHVHAIPTANDRRVWRLTAG
ncbi:hypothetical protein [Kribbella voronezhensis]|uniref:hypothetical protein n=1 Tax=Kribbella voronezhensis TaxID=2512212 RepID=UPI001EDFDE9B|nr:hypothetical protein [Kribbella voronezhensis]